MSNDESQSTDDAQIEGYRTELTDLKSGLSSIQEDFQHRIQELRDRRTRIFAAMEEAMRAKSAEKTRQNLETDSGD